MCLVDGPHAPRAECVGEGEGPENETLGLSLQEALYHGCACVATRIAGNTELVEDQRNGLLVPPGDADSLAGVLERLIGDTALRQQLSAQGRASVLARGMTTAQMVETHRALYAQLLGET